MNGPDSDTGSTSAEDAIAAALAEQPVPAAAAATTGDAPPAFAAPLPASAATTGTEDAPPAFAVPPPAPDGDGASGGLPAAEVEEAALIPHDHVLPEVDDLLHHPGRDLEIHGDFEVDEIAVQATVLPGRSAPGSKRPISFLRRLGWGFWVAAGWMLVMILVAVLAPVLPIASPTQIGSCIPNSGPAAGHLLGCDTVGRDVLARLVYGGQVSLVVGFASIGLALVVGGTLAVVAGYLRGAVDSVLGVITNVLLAFPYLVLGLALVAFWGHGEFQVTCVIAIVAVAPLYRVVRANTIAFAERDYVLAATALGSTRRRILWKQIVPDVVPTAITYALVGVALAVVGEGALSFLGQSVPPNTTPTWGNMIADASTRIPLIGQVPVNLWEILSPSIAMFAFILSINLIGDRLRSVLDVREGVL
jgi:peptide/nickel transport system permease protein